MNDRAEQMNRLAQSWDDAAEGYDAYFVPRFAPWVNAAVDAIRADQLPEGPILVPCCGTFPEADAILGRLPGHDVVGIDLSAEMVRIARDRVRGHDEISVIQGDAATLDAQMTGTHAAIVSVFGLQQLPDPGEALLSWAKALRPGGWLSVIFWPETTETDGPFAWLRELRNAGAAKAHPWEGELSDVLANGGMTVVRDEKISFSMSHPSATTFIDENTHSGPMRALARARGDEYIQQLRDAFLARAPSGMIQHRPAGHHLLAHAK
jgi:SAM-dependent methyltransferase